jgi:hypothetical protein
MGLLYDRQNKVLLPVPTDPFTVILKNPIGVRNPQDQLIIVPAGWDLLCRIKYNYPNSGHVWAYLEALGYGETHMALNHALQHCHILDTQIAAYVCYANHYAASQHGFMYAQILIVAGDERDIEDPEFLQRLAKEFPPLELTYLDGDWEDDNKRDAEMARLIQEERDERARLADEAFEKGITELHATFDNHPFGYGEFYGEPTSAAIYDIEEEEMLWEGLPEPSLNCPTMYTDSLEVLKAYPDWYTKGKESDVP